MSNYGTELFKRTLFKYLFFLAVLFCTTSPAQINKNQNGSTFEFSLNGLQFTIDKNSGSILRLASPQISTILETSTDRASIIDLAYPIKEFEPLRLASKFSFNAYIETSDQNVFISWEKLGASRSLPLSGGVTASIQFKAATDGQSVILSCTIKNNSDVSIRQVLFPDFAGLLPVAGEKHTCFRTTAFVINPFEMLKPDVEMVPFYATGKYHVGNGWIEYKSGKYKNFSQKLVDWLDFGSLNKGFSLYARRWPPEYSTASVMLHLSKVDHKLRILFSHAVEIAAGETWHSDEYWLTPRQHGWAEGIVPFRKWVTQNLQPREKLPQHIKNGMGFRTLWMAKGISQDREQDVLYRYEDLPRIARECKQHGLDELVIWFWCPYFQVPFTTEDNLGSKQDLIEAISECKKIGVNVSLFVSVLHLKNPSAAKYNLIPRQDNSWNYHPELIPNFNAAYASWNQAVLVEQDNQQWQQDVLKSFKDYIDIGLTSFVWDVFWAQPTEPNIYDLAAKIRTAALERDAQSVFAGEGGCNIGEDYKYLDYTWNWNWCWPHYKDFRPFSSVFPAPRLNANIDESAKIVKYCFADNSYMNIMPSMPDGINASDLIVNQPELSRALKQCANLRRQFLAYFVDGTLIGDCILTEQCNEAHISAYVLRDSVLMILVKDENAGTVKFSCDVGYWLPNESEKYTALIYSSEGDLIGEKKINQTKWQGTTPVLQPLDIVLYKFVKVP